MHLMDVFRTTSVGGVTCQPQQHDATVVRFALTGAAPGTQVTCLHDAVEQYNAIRQTKFHVLPDVLVFQLERYPESERENASANAGNGASRELGSGAADGSSVGPRQRRGRGLRVRDQVFYFPTVEPFDMKFSLGDNAASSGDDCRYILSSVIVHTGQRDAGHYRSYVRLHDASTLAGGRGPGWRHFDDARVSDLDFLPPSIFNHDDSGGPSVLCYQRMRPTAHSGDSGTILSRRTVASQGVANQNGFSCYCNSVLQALVPIPEFREAIRGRPTGTWHLQLQRIVDALTSGDPARTSDCPNSDAFLEAWQSHVNAVARVGGETARNWLRQSDAAEFLEELLKEIGRMNQPGRTVAEPEQTHEVASGAGRPGPGRPSRAASRGRPLPPVPAQAARTSQPRPQAGAPLRRSKRQAKPTVRFGSTVGDSDSSDTNADPTAPPPKKRPRTCA